MSITKEEIAESREICEKASPQGEFTYDPMGTFILGPHGGVFAEVRGVGFKLPIEANGFFIAKACSMLPRCLDELEAKDVEINELKRALEHSGKAMSLLMDKMQVEAVNAKEGK